MGDPKKLRKKYKKPGHPWNKVRIEEERKIIDTYGLRNKKEIWKISSLLSRLKRQAKRLIARGGDEQSKKEEDELLNRLKKYNIISDDAKLSDVLNLNIGNFLDRRLQTIVYKKGLCRSIKQARQLILHKHIKVGDKIVGIPSYLLESKEEVKFKENSPFTKEDHPERPKKEVKKEIKEKESEEKKDVKKEIKEEKSEKSVKKRKSKVKEKKV